MGVGRKPSSPPTRESCCDLILDYVPAIPTDDFDGKNLRYAPEKKLLYSVSTNGKDDGGAETDACKHEPDWVFPIAF